MRFKQHTAWWWFRIRSLETVSDTNNNLSKKKNGLWRFKCFLFDLIWCPRQKHFGAHIHGTPQIMVNHIYFTIKATKTSNTNKILHTVNKRQSTTINWDNLSSSSELSHTIHASSKIMKGIWFVHPKSFDLCSSISTQVSMFHLAISILGKILTLWNTKYTTLDF